MRTTVTIEDALLRKAAQLTGLAEKSALLREGLKALIAQESAKRLARLGGTDPLELSAARDRPAIGA